jgi:hypothetical protein
VAHAACPERTQDFVATEAESGREGHKRFGAQNNRIADSVSGWYSGSSRLRAPYRAPFRSSPPESGRELRRNRVASAPGSLSRAR